MTQPGWPLLDSIVPDSIVPEWIVPDGIVIAGLIGLAVIAGVAEHRRMRRSNPDRVGIVPWPLVQFISLFAAILMIAVEFGMAR